MRYLPLTDDDRRQMMSRIGVAHVDELFVDVPREFLRQQLPELPLTKSELEVEREMSALAARNVAAG